MSAVQLGFSCQQACDRAEECRYRRHMIYLDSKKPRGAEKAMPYNRNVAIILQLKLSDMSEFQVFLV